MYLQGLWQKESFSPFAHRGTFVKSRVCVKKMKMQEEVQVDWPWANDAFIVMGENNKHNWPAFHISAVSGCQSWCLFSPLFSSFLKAIRAESEALKDIPVNLGLSAKSPSPYVSFFQFQLKWVSALQPLVWDSKLLILAAKQLP